MGSKEASLPNLSSHCPWDASVSVSRASLARLARLRREAKRFSTATAIQTQVKGFCGCVFSFSGELFVAWFNRKPKRKAPFWGFPLQQMHPYSLQGSANWATKRVRPTNTSILSHSLGRKTFACTERCRHQVSKISASE